MESFWGTLKNELVHPRHYTTRAQAKDDITGYIEIFYNPPASGGIRNSATRPRQYLHSSGNNGPRLNADGVHY